MCSRKDSLPQLVARPVMRPATPREWPGQQRRGEKQRLRYRRQRPFPENDDERQCPFLRSLRGEGLFHPDQNRIAAPPGSIRPARRWRYGRLTCMGAECVALAGDYVAVGYRWDAVKATQRKRRHYRNSGKHVKTLLRAKNSHPLHPINLLELGLHCIHVEHRVLNPRSQPGRNPVRSAGGADCRYFVQGQRLGLIRFACHATNLHDKFSRTRGADLRNSSKTIRCRSWSWVLHSRRRSGGYSASPGPGIPATRLTTSGVVGTHLRAYDRPHQIT